MKKYFFLCSLMATMSFSLFAQDSVEMKTLSCAGIGKVYSPSGEKTDRPFIIRLREGSNLEISVDNSPPENLLVVRNEFYKGKKAAVAGVLTGNETGDYRASTENSLKITNLSSDKTGKRFTGETEIRFLKLFVVMGTVNCGEAELK